MTEFYKYLEMGLQNFEDYQVFAIRVGVVGDAQMYSVQSLGGENSVIFNVLQTTLQR